MTTSGRFSQIKDAVSFTMLDKNFQNGDPGTTIATVVDDTDASGNKALRCCSGVSEVDL